MNIKYWNNQNILSVNDSFERDVPRILKTTVLSVLEFLRFIRLVLTTVAIKIEVLFEILKVKVETVTFE